MRISDWSSDVCSSDLKPQIAQLARQVSRHRLARFLAIGKIARGVFVFKIAPALMRAFGHGLDADQPRLKLDMTAAIGRSEERRVGTEWVMLCSFQWSQENETKYNHYMLLIENI